MGCARRVNLAPCFRHNQAPPPRPVSRLLPATKQIYQEGTADPPGWFYGFLVFAVVLHEVAMNLMVTLNLILNPCMILCAALINSTHPHPPRSTVCRADVVFCQN